jgi:hypothetical protein
MLTGDAVLMANLLWRFGVVWLLLGGIVLAKLIWRE